jgi:hypothetical protein
MARKSMGFKPAHLILFAAILTGFTARFALTVSTLGTNDVVYWQRFMDSILQSGSVEVYSQIRYYNHPPLMSAYLWVISHWITYAPNGFAFLIRLPATLADLGSTFLVYRLLLRFNTLPVAVLGASVIALSPVLIAVSGFHGNTDPVFAFLILLAAERLISRRALWQSALALGLALNIKIVPVLVWPIFFFWLNDNRQRIAFFSVVVACLVAGFGYHLSQNFSTIKENIFDYSGIWGIWGIGQLLFSFPELSGPARFFSKNGKFFMLMLIAWRAWKVAERSHRPTSTPQEREQSLLRGIAWTFLLFYCCTSGFGIQYLAWIIPSSVFLGLGFAIGYQVLAGTFVLGVYTYWSKGFPWYFADSDAVGPWGGYLSLLSLILWTYLILSAVVLLRRERVA